MWRVGGWPRGGALSLSLFIFISLFGEVLSAQCSVLSIQYSVFSVPGRVMMGWLRSWASNRLPANADYDEDRSPRADELPAVELIEV